MTMASASTVSSSPLLGTRRLALSPCSSASSSVQSCFAGKFSSSASVGRAGPDNAQGFALIPATGKRRHEVWGRAAVGGRGSDPVLQEEVFFDGGPHYGDLVANILFGFTLVWLPLTLAAVFRNLFLRYRFTNLRVTILSGLTGDDRKDFGYEVITDVQVVPRFIGEWGDIVFTLKDGTKIDLRCVPSFREVAKYCRDKAGEKKTPGTGTEAAIKGFAS